MILYALSAIAASLGFFRPLWGFGIFLLANSGAAGFFEKMGILGGQLGPFRPENMAIIGAIAGLWFRRTAISGVSPNRTAIGIFLWIVSVIIPLSRVVETGDLWLMIKMVNYSLLWAPLFIVLQKLTPDERSNFHNLIIGVSALTALLTVVTVVSGSNYLYQILSIYRFDQVKEIKPNEFVTARVTLPGLWSCTYLGFWFSIKELIGQTKSRVSTLLYGTALVFMTTAFIFNLTRTIIIGIFTGLFVVVVLSMLFLKNIKKSRVVLAGLIIFVTAVYMLQHFEGLSERYQERFSTVTQSLTAKTDKNEYMLEILTDERPVLGHKDDNREKFVGGDPHTFIRIWWDYGIIVSMSLVMIFLIAFLKLFKILSRQRFYPREIVAMAICMLAFFLQLQFEMVSGYYLFPEPLFILIVFFSEIAVISQEVSLQTEGITERRQYGTGRSNIPPKRKIRITW